jgi:DNA-binding transcriptional LysR family regulator
MDRLESMSVLVAAVEAGSLSAGARRLGMPLTTVSRKVAELEAHLRTRLLNRTSRRLTLTDAGRSYLVACKRILDQIAEAERAAMGEYSAPKGDLLVAAPIVFGRLHVLPVVVEFLQTYPEIDVRMLLSDHVTNLLEEQIDVALRIGELPDSSMMATRIGEIRRVVCASAAYLAARGTPQAPADLHDHDCVTFEGMSAPLTWRFGQGKSEVAVAVHSRLIVNTAEAAIDAAIAGVGLTRVLSYQVAEAERSGAVLRVLRGFEPGPVPIHLVYGGQSPLALKLRVFLEFAAPRLKARLALAHLKPVRRPR